MRRPARYLLIGLPIALAVAAGVLLLVVLRTGSGASWALARAEAAFGHDLSVERVSGSLLGGLDLQGLRYRGAGFELYVESVHADLGLGFNPPVIHVKRLQAGPARLTLLERPESPDNAAIDPAGLLGRLRLPLLLDVDAAQVHDLEITRAGGAHLYGFSSVELTGHWFESLENFRISWLGDTVNGTLGGRIQLHEPFIHHLELQAEAPPLEQSFRLSVDGDARRTAVQLSSPTLGLQAAGSIEAPLGPVEAGLNFEIGHLDLPGAGAAANRLTGIKGTLAFSGGVFRVQGGGELDGYGLPPMRLELQGQGDWRALDVEHLTASGQGIEASAAGRLGLEDWPSASLDVDLHSFDPSVLGAAWPSESPLTGRLTLHWSGDSVRLDDIRIEPRGGSAEVTGLAAIDPASRQMTAELAWQNLVWPLPPAQALASSPAGSATLAGDLDAWTFTSQLDLQSPRYPGGTFKLSGKGSANTAEIRIESGEALGGSLDGTASLNWEDGIRWSADLNVRNLASENLSSEWPGRLNAQLSLAEDRELQRLELHFRELQGVVREAPVTGQGGLIVDPRGLRLEQVELTAGDARVSASGSLQGAEGIRFDLAVPGPGLAASLLGGQFTGHGRFAPAAEPPVVDLDLEGREITWGSLSMGGLTVKPMQAGRPAGMALTAEATDIVVGERKLPEAYLSLQGDRTRQTLGLRAVKGDFELNAELVGSLADWSRLPDFAWQGQLSRLSLVQGLQPLATLRAPAALSVTPAEWSIAGACLDLAESGGICVTAAERGAGNRQLDLAMSRVPLNLARYAVGPDFEFTQRADGEFHWQQVAGRRPSGAASLDLSPGRFGNVEDPDAMLETGPGYFGFEMQDGDLNSGRLQLPLPGVGSIDADFNIANVRLDGSGQLQGQARIRVDDIGSLENLTASLEGLQGSFQADLSLAGTVGDPLLRGTVTLRGGEFDYPNFGTRLKNLQLDGQVDAGEVLRLGGGFDAGEGHADLQATVDLSELFNPSLSLDLAGHNLRLVDMANMSVDADTDLVMGWRGGNTWINGEVTIPRARLSPATSITRRVSESQDVVVVAGKLPAAEQAVESAPSTLSGGVGITLGDDVRFATDLADMKLGGRVELNWQDSPVPTGNGAISVQGEIRAFGPSLQVEEGFVRFPDVPVDNPRLDIRAERDIYGNSQIHLAGVAITGTARRPVIEAYTRPETTQDRAWALLITGSDFDYSQGIGALDVGTYVAPKLYVSYGISLFEDENVVSARYDLKKGFGVKATTGKRETGIDISYTVDR